MVIDEEKSQQRKHFLGLRRRAFLRLQDDDHQSLIRGIVEVLDRAAAVPETVCGYVPIRSEANVMPALHVLMDAGWSLALPCVEAVGHCLTWRLWKPDEELAPDPVGVSVRQPAVTAPLAVPSGIAVILVPLVAVDCRGVRLGYGGGYYDRSVMHLVTQRRAMRQLPPVLVGVAFEEQRSTSLLPCHDHDLRLDWLVTHRRVWSPKDWGAASWEASGCTG